MLVLMTSKEITDKWDTLKGMIAESMIHSPSANESRRMNNILKALLCERLECWAIQSDEGKGLGILTTTVAMDECDGTYSLLIYSLYAFEELTKDVIKEGMITLIRYARGKDCIKVSAYTKLESVRKFLERLGGDATHYVSINI